MGRRSYTRAVYFYSKVDLTYQSLAAIVPIYVMILTGVLVRRIGWLKPEADSSFVRMAIDVTLPCFIIYNMLGMEAYITYSNQTDTTVQKALEVLENGESFPKAPEAEIKK